MPSHAMGLEYLLRRLSILIIETESIDEVAARNRNIFRALTPCPLSHTSDTRTGMLCNARRRVMVFRRWHIRHSDTQVFIPREKFK